MDITEITSQSLSTLICDHLTCGNCHIVDRDHDRMRTGTICSTCGEESNGGRLYYSIGTHIIIDLIQETYHSRSIINASENKGVKSNDISVIIFFCTLREMLLDKLITELLVAENIPLKISERLLSDNKFHRQKQDNLFKSLTGVKWKEAISSLNKSVELDYCKIDNFVSKAVEARNNFIHEGSHWSINPKLPTECLQNMWGLINIYVGLHNEFVHPMYKKL